MLLVAQKLAMVLLISTLEIQQSQKLKQLKKLKLLLEHLSQLKLEMRKLISQFPKIQDYQEMLLYLRLFIPMLTTL